MKKMYILYPKPSLFLAPPIFSQQCRERECIRLKFQLLMRMRWPNFPQGIINLPYTDDLLGILNNKIYKVGCELEDRTFFDEIPFTKLYSRDGVTAMSNKEIDEMFTKEGGAEGCILFGDAVDLKQCEVVWNW